MPARSVTAAAADPLVGSTAPLVFGLAAVLVVVGIALVAVGLRLVHTTRADHEALGRLEVMGERSWRRSDVSGRAAALERARAAARPIDSPAASAPVPLRLTPIDTLGSGAFVPAASVVPPPADESWPTIDALGTAPPPPPPAQHLPSSVAETAPAPPPSFSTSSLPPPPSTPGPDRSLEPPPGVDHPVKPAAVRSAAAPLPAAGDAAAPVAAAGDLPAPVPIAGDLPAPVPISGDLPAPVPAAGDPGAPVPSGEGAPSVAGLFDTPLPGAPGNGRPEPHSLLLPQPVATELPASRPAHAEDEARDSTPPRGGAVDVHADVSSDSRSVGGH